MARKAHSKRLPPASTRACNTRKAASISATPFKSSAVTLLEWPLDVLLILLEKCPLPTLFALARTCKTLHVCSIPILYKDLDLSGPNPLKRNQDRWIVEPYQKRDREGQKAVSCQTATIEYLLNNPHVAHYIKELKYTIGIHSIEHRASRYDLKRYDLKAHGRCFRMFNLLENVETVHIDGHIFTQSFKMYEQLSDRLFPNVKVITIRGNTKFLLANKFLLGCDKPRLERVELGWITNMSVLPTYPYPHVTRSPKVYFGTLIPLRARRLKSFAYRGENVPFARAPEDAPKDTRLYELKGIGEKIVTGTWKM
jgi:hypothetical protein